MSLIEACSGCLRRTWLITRLAGHVNLHRDRLAELMALGDEQLIAAVGGAQRERVAAEYADYRAGPARSAIAQAGLDVVCSCRHRYPARLRELDTPPRAVHVAFDAQRLIDLITGPVVAIVGSREPSSYGIQVATELGRGLAAAGVTVLSGMARGIDSHAQRGALAVGGPTVAVLAGAAERAYPPRGRSLHTQISRQGAVVSEFPPGTSARRWMFPARNRVIAALADMTVVVEARSGSGSLITANLALSLGRRIGAVPGRVGSPLARGPHALIRRGADVIDGAEAVLEALFGAGQTIAPAEQLAVSQTERAILEALAEGRDVPAALRRGGLAPGDALPALAELELRGLITRDAGGAYTVALGWRSPG
jgi:DNA processing protein